MARSLFAVAAALVFGLVGSAIAQEWQAEPRFGTIGVAPGFAPDPITVIVTAGGSDSTGDLGPTCLGYIDNRKPDFDVNLSGSMEKLSFFVDGKGDTTLVINDPTGSWHCNDDFSGEAGLNPAITFSEPQPGNYNVWVGNHNAGDFYPVALKLTAGDPSWHRLNEAKPKSAPEAPAKVSVKDWGEPTEETPVDAGSIDWGDDASPYANDNECDDPRFDGPGVHSILLDSDRMHDATDCRTLFEQGRIHLK